MIMILLVIKIVDGVFQLICKVHPEVSGPVLAGRGGGGVLVVERGVVIRSSGAAECPPWSASL